jgi:hypothetical protein
MGSTSGDPSIINCVNYATVSAGRYAAGILGFGSANVYSSANHGDMSTRVGYAGGIVAFGYDNIVQDCLNTGNISGGNAFGLGHMNQGSCKLSNFLNLGSASSDGVSDKGATNCYSVSKTSVSGATRIDADDVRVTSGELAFLLGGTWGQEIGKDANPVPGGMKVYRNVEPSSICTNIVYTYSNTQGNQTINHDVNLGAEAFDNGICKNCGKTEAVDDPSDPTAPDDDNKNETPDNGESDEKDPTADDLEKDDPAEEKLGLFERIWRAIVEFFRKLFGKSED